MGVLRRVEHPSGLIVYRSPRFEELGLPHAFTTRIGAGGAELCAREPDSLSRAALLDVLGATGEPPVRFARQVHGAIVLEPAPEEQVRDAPADALVTGHPNHLIGVYTADCVPVLITTVDGSRVAAVHAGWKGLLAGVIPAALGHFGGQELAAAIGACLSVDRCEMGPEVTERFEAADLGASIRREPGRRDRIDVRHAARLQLERGGVHAVDVSDRCTFDDAGDFGSHRRDVTHGDRRRATSQGALVGIGSRGS